MNNLKCFISGEPCAEPNPGEAGGDHCAAPQQPHQNKGKPWGKIDPHEVSF